jgi:transposase
MPKPVSRTVRQAQPLRTSTATWSLPDAGVNLIEFDSNGKNNGNDAEAICEAVSRPSMRFVPIKTLEKQAVLCLHRVRQGFVEERTATINRLRGLLAEFGLVLPPRAAEVRRHATECAHHRARQSLLTHAARHGCSQRIAARG